MQGTVDVQGISRAVLVYAVGGCRLRLVALWIRSAVSKLCLMHGVDPELRLAHLPNNLLIRITENSKVQNV